MLKDCTIAVSSRTVMVTRATSISPLSGLVVVGPTRKVYRPTCVRSMSSRSASADATADEWPSRNMSRSMVARARGRRHSKWVPPLRTHPPRALRAPMKTIRMRCTCPEAWLLALGRRWSDAAARRCVKGRARVPAPLL